MIFGSIIISYALYCETKHGVNNMINFRISLQKLANYRIQGNLPLNEIFKQARETLDKRGKFIIQEDIPDEEPTIIEVIDSLEKFEEWKTRFTKQSTEDS